jgi:OPT oligopeptide transporter protein
MASLVIMTFWIRERIHPKYRPFVPNWGSIGLAWVIPNESAASYSFAMVCGAFVAYFTQRFWPRKWDTYGFPVAAGLAAGEACSGLIVAILVIVGKDGDTVGSQIGVGWT